mmetsp:Transcript_83387/g.258980  ORF Transcript_83387/g.258980 Transcript_83387/m.258980 type:complete len:200 (+) Transcript_83387:230-829(+)
MPWSASIASAQRLWRACTRSLSLLAASGSSPGSCNSKGATSTPRSQRLRSNKRTRCAASAKNWRSRPSARRPAEAARRHSQRRRRQSSAESGGPLGLGRLEPTRAGGEASLAKRWQACCSLPRHAASPTAASSGPPPGPAAARAKAARAAKASRLAALCLSLCSMPAARCSTSSRAARHCSSAEVPSKPSTSSVHRSSG